MSVRIEPRDNIADAWADTLRHVNSQPGGRDVHVMTTVTAPLAPENPAVRAIIAPHLTHRKLRGAHLQPIETVAGTLFSDLYHSPGYSWSPALANTDAEARLNAAANALYDNYGRILPRLVRVPANNRGTYFGRMISWPGKQPGGHNQIAWIVRKLRRIHGSAEWNNKVDIAVSGEAELSNGADLGVQMFRNSDNTEYGFPCLVHLDLSLVRGQLHMHALYRHQMLLTKAYGNALGLTRLLRFICEQSGWAAGEFVMHAAVADAEHTNWTKTEVNRIVVALDRAQS